MSSAGVRRPVVAEGRRGRSDATVRLHGGVHGGVPLLMSNRVGGGVSHDRGGVAVLGTTCMLCLGDAG